MIPYTPAVQATAGARSGIAPAHLFDVQKADGTVYYWADRAMLAPVVITVDEASAQATYLPWVVTPPTIKTYRSLQTDTVSFVLQNISGDTLARDFEKIVRRSVMEGAFCVYRIFQGDAQFSLREFHGKITISNISKTSAQITLSSSNDFSQTDALTGSLGENCGLVWGEARCGASTANGAKECLYSYLTCQVPERFQGVVADYEKDYQDAIPSVPLVTINRRRSF